MESNLTSPSSGGLLSLSVHESWLPTQLPSTHGAQSCLEWQYPDDFPLRAVLASPSACHATLRLIMLDDGDATLGADLLARPHHAGDVRPPAVPRSMQHQRSLA